MHRVRRYRPHSGMRRRGAQRGSMRAQRGFTLVELLVIIVIISVLAIILWPSLHKMILRNRLQGQATEVSIAMRQARLEAIKRTVPTVMRADFVNDQTLVFVDVDADGSFTPNPTAPRGTVDFELRSAPLPGHVTFAGPSLTVEGADAVDGFTTDPEGGPNQVVFNPDGSVEDAGAFRFADPKGNVLEVRVSPPATARIELRKWDGSDFFAQREGGEPWRWAM